MWNVSLRYIQENPWPHSGFHTEPNFFLGPQRYYYEIVRETSVSGQELFIFLAGYAWWSIVYFIDEAPPGYDGDVVILFIRRR